MRIFVSRAKYEQIDDAQWVISLFTSLELRIKIYELRDKNVLALLFPTRWGRPILATQN